MKEWAGWTSKHNIDTEFQRPPYSTIDVPVADTPGFHELERAHKEIPGKEGYRRLYYDHGLIEWFEFVAGLAGRSSRSS